MLPEDTRLLLKKADDTDAFQDCRKMLCNSLCIQSHFRNVNKEPYLIYIVVHYLLNFHYKMVCDSGGIEWNRAERPKGRCSATKSVLNLSVRGFRREDQDRLESR